MSTFKRINTLVDNKFFILFCCFVNAYPTIVRGALANYNVNPIKHIVNLLLYIVILYRLVYFVFSKRRIPAFSFLVFFYYLVRIILYTIRGEDLLLILAGYIDYQHLALLLFLDIELEEKNYKNVFWAASLFTQFYCYINFVTVFLHHFINPKINYFLGNRNYHAALYLLALTAVYLVSYEKNEKHNFNFCLLFMLSFISSIITNAGTAIAVFGLALISIIIAVFDKKGYFINSINLDFAILIEFLSFVIFKIQDYFSFFIKDILGKSLTFSGRTEIWDKCIKLVSKSPVIGCADLSGNIWVYYEKTRKMKCYPGIHNVFLQQLFDGGIILLVMFLIISSYVSYKLFKRKEKMSMLSIFVFSILLLFSFCQSNRDIIFGIMLLVCGKSKCFEDLNNS